MERIDDYMPFLRRQKETTSTELADEIQSDIQRFLQGGGEIQHVAPGVTAENPSKDSTGKGDRFGGAINVRRGEQPSVVEMFRQND